MFKSVFIIIAGACLLGASGPAAGSPSAAGANPIQEGVVSMADKDAILKSAATWLDLIDQNAFGQSWDRASEHFKQAVPAHEWMRKASSARSPMGTLIAREQQSMEFQKSFPGAPDGEYAVIHYKSTLTQNPQAEETLTLMKDGNGAWKVAEYIIK